MIKLVLVLDAPVETLWLVALVMFHQVVPLPVLSLQVALLVVLVHVQ